MNKLFQPLRTATSICYVLYFYAMPVLAQTVQHPFPQHQSYYQGVILPNQVSLAQLDSSTEQFYNQWKAKYIRWDAEQGMSYVWVNDAVPGIRSLSEGQGYGMMVVVKMAGYDRRAQELFDGLFLYCQQHGCKRNPLLMAWAQDEKFSNTDETSSADGDMDIAYALLLADAQWGSSGSIHYRQEAVARIGAMEKDELNPITSSMLMSNAIEIDSRDYFDMRSSDFMPGHCMSFFTFTGDSVWKRVVDSTYRLFDRMQQQYSADAGLLPDFICHLNHRPSPAHPGYLESRYDGCYNYNACRVPWRLASGYLHSGDERAKKILGKINHWIRATTGGNPDNISAGYTLAGDDLKFRHFEALSFIVSFGVSAMVDPENQQWLNALWNYIHQFPLNDFDYYDNSLRMLAMIALSGNDWEPSAAF